MQVEQNGLGCCDEGFALTLAVDCAGVVQWEGAGVRSLGSRVEVKLDFTARVRIQASSSLCMVTNQCNVDLPWQLLLNSAVTSRHSMEAFK